MSDAKIDKPLEGGGFNSSDISHSSDRNDDNNSHSRSSADNVERHLLGLESSDGEGKSLSHLEDQDFSEDELSGVINVKRLQALLQQSDAFLGYLSGEVDDFDDSNNDDFH
ncbi:MAG: hypothetical protein Q4P13_12440 [Psychrobacter sp.]|nr:hypothetical protein [Psychrobacter sp.]